LEKDDIMINERQKEILKKMKDISVEQINIIENGKEPSIEFKMRGKNNAVFNRKLKFIDVGEKVETRKYNNPSSVKTYMQFLSVMKALKQKIEEGKVLTLRQLFYILKTKISEDISEKIFDEQNQSNSIATDLELLLGVERSELNLTVSPRAFASGNLVVEETFQGKPIDVDFSIKSSTGVAISSNPDLYKIKKADFDYILVLEKYTIYSALLQSDFQKRNNCLIATSSGFTSRNLRRLCNILNKPIYVLTDGDISGMNIFTTFAYGSFALSWLSKKLANPNAKWLGLKIKDVYDNKNLKYITNKHLTMPLRKSDEKKIKIMKEYEFLKGTKFEEEMNIMLDKKIQIESDVLVADENIMTLENYILDNIKKKNYLNI
jgi:DNA topoisomerase-6 subunit A